MAIGERIEWKPEYDAEDWEVVEKIKQFVEERGFSFGEVKNDPYPCGDVTVGWDSSVKSVLSDLWVNAQIPDLADALKGMQHLKNVDVSSGCQDVRWAGTLHGIESIRFHGRNDSFQLPDTWASLSTLTDVTIFYDEYEFPPTVHPSLQKLTKLRDLRLWNASAPLNLPDWLGELPNLKHLSLMGSHIQSIPYSLVRTGLPFITDVGETPDDGQYISLRFATLEEGDISLFSQPREVIEAYYRGREDKPKQSVRECKVIFLGKGGAGKSSLIYRMEHPEEPLPETLPTNGVSVTKWNVTAPDGPLSLRVMDFGGQEIMHSMHRCFLTAHTVYVIVCDSREDGGVDAEAVMWVEAVKTFAPDCPVILALNKADLSENVSVDTKDLKRRNPSLKTVLKTSAVVEPGHSGYGVKLLADAILQEVPGCMDRMKVSPEWLAVKRELEDMVEKDIDTFTADDYREICIRHNTGDDDTLRFKMLGYFKDLGVAYFYNPTDGEPNYSMESIRVSNPAWITNGIYRLIVKADNIGFLPRSKIKEILETPYEGDTLPNRIYDREKADFILHVMRMFRISMPFGKDTEMVPMKMPKEPPNSADDYPYDTAIHLRWEASYLPDNLVHRLIIEMSRNLYKGPDGNYCVWRRGARFRRNKCDALASMDEKGLDVYVHGEDSGAVRAYMENFRDAVSGILLDLHIDAAEMIYYTRDGFEGKIPFDDVMDQFTDAPDEKIYIRPSRHGIGRGQKVHPRELLKAIYPNWEELAEKYQSSQLRGLELEMRRAEVKKKQLENQQAEMDNRQKVIDTNHYEKSVEAREQREAAENRKLNAEAGQVKAEMQKTTAEASQARAEARQTRTDIEIKRSKEQWKKWLVWGLATLLLIVTAVLIIMTVLGVINWSKVASTLISFVLFWLLVKKNLEKE